jgi:hypothetical protein
VRSSATMRIALSLRRTMDNPPLRGRAASRAEGLPGELSIV